MGSNLVVVAIPEEQDRVWKISSEKVPHLTLLFLGDADSNPHVQTITEFVQHAVDISEHGQFYLDVDRRDVLGPDEADVVFFSKRSWNLKWITQFRNQLLQQNAIRTAYDSITQYPEWQPHLTLGYPTSPAKELDGAFDHPIYSVCFDRIAVWTGDYEGPEFRLEWPERMSDGLAVEYSSMNEERAKAGLAAIEHHGIKGMKWGVRKDQIGSGARAVGRGAAKLHFELTANSDEVHRQIAIGAHAKLKADLPAIKAKHPVGGKLGNRLKNPASPEARAYRKDVKAAYLNHLEATANEHTNISGNRRYTLKRDTWRETGKPNTSKYFWEVKTEATPIQHAAASATIRVHPVFDADGYITDLELVEDTLTQGADFVENVLMHHGIKGMRWGVRNHREAPHAVAPAATSHVPHGDKNKTKIEVAGGENHPAHPDAIKVAQAKVKLAKSGTAALSNQELRDVATRVQLEQQVKQLTMSRGRKFAKRLLGQQGNQFANQAANKAGKAATKRAAAAVLL